jgi:uncharacterized protein (TIGR01777 family)
MTPQSANRVALTGSGGFLGRAVSSAFRARGIEVRRLVRREARAADEIGWDPSSAAPPEGLAACSAVIHLAGEPIADGRWTPERKDRILRSRVDGTRRIALALAARPGPLPALLCASGINIYGVRDDAAEEAEAPVAPGFLASVCRAWEAAAEPARAAGGRVVHLRMAPVLGRGGGVMGRLLPVFRAGLGGPLGDGRQPMAWIEIDDAIAAIAHLLARPDLDGPFTLVAPETVTQREFARALGRALRRPALLPTPAPLLRAIFGGMADELMLGGIRIRPRRLLDSGFVFRHPELQGALRHILQP